MNKILLLTDFSDNARNAILYALKAFPPENFQYLLLNCYDRIHTTMEVNISLSEKMHNDSQIALTKEEDLVRQITGTNVTFEKISFLGFLSEAVNRLAKEKQPDLVVMGTKGETGLPAILIGSRASSLIKAINLPLLIIPEKSEFTGLKDVVFAADVKTLNKPEHIEPLSQFAKAFGSRLTVVNVSKESKGADMDNSEEGKKLMEKLNAKAVEFRHIADGDAGNAIATYVHENPCDLLVVVERSRQFIVDLFHKSVSKRLALHLETPLLVLHA